MKKEELISELARVTGIDLKVLESMSREKLEELYAERILDRKNMFSST